jgi:hypothetical protein
MTKLSPRIVRTAVAMLAYLGMQSVAFSQVTFTGSATITYGPLATIPTLSEWGQIGLILLMAALAYRYFRSSGRNWPVASVVMAGVAGVLLVTGTRFSNDALAVPATLDLPGGGSVTYCPIGSNPIQVNNSTTIPLTIQSISYGQGSSAGNGNTCLPGTTVRNGGSCILILNVTSTTDNTQCNV